MRIRALVKRIVWQLVRDKRTIALLFMAPLLILTLMHFLFTSNGNSSRVGIEGLSNEMVEQLENLEIDVLSFQETKNIENAIVVNELDGYLFLKDGTLNLTIENTDPSRSKLL